MIEDMHDYSVRCSMAKFEFAKKSKREKNQAPPRCIEKAATIATEHNGMKSILSFFPFVVCGIQRCPLHIALCVRARTHAAYSSE